jgi:hypothetical protein
MATINKSEKRRGRPPKNLVVATPIKNKSIVKVPQEEQLVLYLPSFDDEQSETAHNRISKDTDGYTETEKNNFNSDDESESNLKIKHLTDRNDSDDSESFSTHNNLNINIKKLLEELQKRDGVINSLKSKLKDKSIFNENTLTLTKENKKHLINIGLITINKNKINICEKTNISCWWCTYQFDTQPLFLPDHYKNNVYHVFGNFCGFACMLAYNENLDDYRKSVRAALIKQLYREIFNCDEMNIIAAGPREILEKFGGPMNINKFRDMSSLSSKTIKISIPPMIPLISDYEEIVIDK